MLDRYCRGLRSVLVLILHKTSVNLVSVLFASSPGNLGCATAEAMRATLAERRLLPSRRLRRSLHPLRTARLAPPVRASAVGRLTPEDEEGVVSASGHAATPSR